MPKVSVIIAAYNHEKYISYTLKSVLSQTFQDFEIIIIDDNSTDNTVEEIKQFNDPRIKLIENSSNKGQFENTNTAISSAKGKYIAILNSDDAFHPEKLEKQFNYLETNPDKAAVFTLVNVIDEDNNKIKDNTHFYAKIFNQQNRSGAQWLNYFFYYGNCLCHPSVMIKKSIHEEIGLYDSRFAQLADLDFWVKLCLKHDIHILQENLTKFRIRSNDANTSGDNIHAQTRSAYEFSQLYKNYLKIFSLEEYLKIFPSEQKTNIAQEPALISFNLARLAINAKSTAHKKFGLDTLFELMNNPIIRLHANKHYSFTNADLISLTASVEALNYNAQFKNDKCLNELLNYCDMEQYFLNSSKNQELEKFIKEQGDKKICLWGAGAFAQTIVKILKDKIKITAIIDKDPAKEDKNMENITIYPPNKLKNINPDIIIPSVLHTEYLLPQIKDFIADNDLKAKVCTIFDFK